MDQVIYEAQYDDARAKGAALAAAHSPERPARALYAELLGYLERRCPAVFFGLNARQLYGLLGKGSQPVAGQVLSAYRAERARELLSPAALPLPTDARARLNESLEILWDSAFEVARREVQSVDELVSRRLQQQLTDTVVQEQALRATLAEKEAALQQVISELSQVTQDLMRATQHNEELGRWKITLEAELLAVREDRAATQEAYEGLSRKALLEVDQARQELQVTRKRDQAAIDELTTALRDELRARSAAEAMLQIERLRGQLREKKVGAGAARLKRGARARGR